MFGLLRRAKSAITPAPEPIALGASEAMRAQMIALQRVSFDALTVPSISPAMLQEMECYTKAALDFQVMFCDHRIRLDLARRLGLTEFTMDGAVELLTGAPAKRIAAPIYHAWPHHHPRASIDAMRSDLDASIFRMTLSMESSRADKAPLHVDERVSSPQWACIPHPLSFGAMDRLRVPIPAGCILKAGHLMTLTVPYATALEKSVTDAIGNVYQRNEGDQRIRSHDLKTVFDGIALLAPTDCFASPKPKDPAIFAMVKGPWDPMAKTCDHRFFFIGRWD